MRIRSSLSLSPFLSGSGSWITGAGIYRLKTLTGDFDLIFVDANKDGYAGYVKTILDRQLLSPNGIILCDNGEIPPLFLPRPPRADG